MLKQLNRSTRLSILGLIVLLLPLLLTSSALASSTLNNLADLTALPPIAQEAYAKASNTDGEDQFGLAIAISGDTLVVGAHREDSNATGVNGDESDNSADNAGAVYVFRKIGGIWSQEAYLKASNTDAGDSFGAAVDISGDTIVVGAPDEDSNATGINGDESDNSAALSGAVYVFQRTGSTWNQQAYIKASNTDAYDLFGTSVAISGNSLVVGAYQEESTARGINGDETDNSGAQVGAAYVFRRTGNSWQQNAYLKASNAQPEDLFGFDVNIDGNTIIVSALLEDSNATGVNGDQINDSTKDSGAVYVFRFSGGNWVQEAYVKASNTGRFDAFGVSLDISGNTMVVGTSSEDSNATGVNGDETDNSLDRAGAAYVFVRDGSMWSQQAYLKASNTGFFDHFGRTVSVSGNTIIVGAYQEDSDATGLNGNESNDNAENAGSAYIFRRNGTTWQQRIYLKASNTESPDQFGRMVAIDGSTFAVGAILEASGATGINGDELDNSAYVSGAVYIFGRTTSNN